MVRFGMWHYRAIWDMALTAVSQHASGDLQQHTRVAADHDEQRQQEEAAEREHVVERLLPAQREAAVRRALREGRWGGDGYLVEEKSLAERKVWWMDWIKLGEREILGQELLY